MTATGPDGASAAPRGRTLAIVGGRGHVGAELIGVIAGHPEVELVLAASRSLAGAPVADHVPGYSGPVRFEDLSPADVAARGADAVVLALPNGGAAEYAAALTSPDAGDGAPGTAGDGDPGDTAGDSDPDDTADDTAGRARGPVIIDVSADHRFDDGWVYGLPERFRDRIRGATRIASPGCYATAAQLAVWPLADLLAEPPHLFGVSGYSGAGTTPSPRNDPELLRDNLLPYALTGHLHQREVSRHLVPVYFTPHVAAFFRGICLTASMRLTAPIRAAAVRARFEARYGAEPLVAVSAGDDIPLVRDVAGRDHAVVGGFSVDPTDPRHVVVVAAIDNLRKGAATQAVQSLNLALGLDEMAGLRSASPASP